MTTKDFESFLSMKYGELVNNTEDNTPNDELWERKYNDWLMQLEPDEFIKYANEFKKRIIYMPNYHEPRQRTKKQGTIFIDTTFCLIIATLGVLIMFLAVRGLCLMIVKLGGL